MLVIAVIVDFCKPKLEEVGAHEGVCDSPYSHSSGVQGEKPDLLSCFDLLISLNKSWDVHKVRTSLNQYKYNTIIDANNFGLTFDKFCDIFKVPLYDPVLSKYISEPGYRALLGPDAISFVENYFKKNRGEKPLNEEDGRGVEDKKEDPQSQPLSTSPRGTQSREGDK
ncbi:hypothetical protein TrCOL_g13003 [Triparma columacea]|uniref:Uncharacterized protein n=1 Tax=Triparma columacea TaxID=722753 RepID=A0A9W7L9N6_9STRA|nr:hypothetical protein TrCOL_g13003 [Triparma columacea]